MYILYVLYLYLRHRYILSYNKLPNNCHKQQLPRSAWNCQGRKGGAPGEEPTCREPGGIAKKLADHGFAETLLDFLGFFHGFFHGFHKHLLMVPCFFHMNQQASVDGNTYLTSLRTLSRAIGDGQAKNSAMGLGCT